MDLFENAINGNNKYVRPPPTVIQEVIIPELEADKTDMNEDSGIVDPSILPSSVIEVRGRWC